MDRGEIYITHSDLKRLKELLQVGIISAGRDRESLENLHRELDRAHIVGPTVVPHDVVTMNSRVRFRDLETNVEKTYTLVFPSEANLERRRISVLAPIG